MVASLSGIYFKNNELEYAFDKQVMVYSCLINYLCYVQFANPVIANDSSIDLEVLYFTKM